MIIDQEEVSFCQQDPFYGCSPYARGGMNVAADTEVTLQVYLHF